MPYPVPNQTKPGWLRPAAITMDENTLSASSEGKHTGITFELAGMGRVEVAHLLKKTSETAVYHTSLPGIVVKIFDLDCGRPDEISYGPYQSYRLELENFQDLAENDVLSPHIPVFFGADLNEEGKYAYIVMEFLEGLDMQSWCDNAAEYGHPGPWIREFKEAIYETLEIAHLFHQNQIILTDFKPDNVIRLPHGKIKFVDLGAFYTPRQSRDAENYLYSTTPDYAELVIDTSNLQANVPLTQASDIFSAGVALFELSTGRSRLAISAESADYMLQNSEIYLFRDSQIKDVWRWFPHLEPQLPLLETQLRERQILFSELWHLLKGYVAHERQDWLQLTENQQSQILIDVGLNFIQQQLPPPLQWLANPISQATTLRRLRCPSMLDLLHLIADPIPPETRTQITRSNSLVAYLVDLDRPIDFLHTLNSWDVYEEKTSGQVAIAAHIAHAQIPDLAPLTFLHETTLDPAGHHLYQIVADTEADPGPTGKLTLADICNDRTAWLGNIQ